MASAQRETVTKKAGEITQGGIALSCMTLSPADPKGAVIIVHGINDHKGRYLALQEDLADAGFASLAYDQRGFGVSGGGRGDVVRYQDYHDDLKAMLLLLCETFPEKPVFILGHSLGGLVAATFCIDFPDQDFPEGISGLILSSPAYDVPYLPAGLEFVVSLLNRMMPTTAISYPSLRHKRSHDPAVVAAVASDPLIIVKATPRFYGEFRRMNESLQTHAEKIPFPTLILQAGDDAIVTPEGARLLFERLKNPEKKLIWYDDFYHEVFHEIERARVVSDLKNWLNAQLS